MPSNPQAVRLREMTSVDVPAVVDVQEQGAIVGLAEVFPQHAYPFPRDVVARRWLAEIADPATECYVVIRGSSIVGFAAVREDQFLHFGIAVEHWGSGVAGAAHDAVIERMRARGVRRAWLRVFTKNARGRRFYEKLGWAQTDERSRSTFPPYAELLRYERDLGDIACRPAQGTGVS